MRTETINIYTIDELSDKAKDKAHRDWLSRGYGYDWTEESQQSLEIFGETFPITIKKWEVSTFCYSYVDIELNLSDHARYEGDDTWEAIAKMTGLRLRTWLINNYWHKLYQGKYYGSLPKTFADGSPIPVSKEHPAGMRLVTRLSRVLFEERSLTGYYLDLSLTYPIREFIKMPDDTSTLLDIMQRCVDSWKEDYIKDMEWQESMEYFIEQARANEYEYEVTGSQF